MRRPIREQDSIGFGWAVLLILYGMGSRFRPAFPLPDMDVL